MKKLKLFFLLGLIVSGLSGCEKNQDDGKIHVTFDTCIDLKTNKIKEQVYDEPHKVKKPVVVIIDDNPDNLAVYGWYREKTFDTPWNFKVDLATESMTLYAKFVPQCKVDYYQGFNENSFSLLASETVFKNEVVPIREDLTDCYENPNNFYIADLTDNDDGTKKGTIVKEAGRITPKPVCFGEDLVEENLSILLTRSANFYLSPAAIQRRFQPVASCAGTNGSTLGRIEVIDEGSEDEHARVDFGIVSDRDPVADPYILIDNPAIDVTSSPFIEIKMKNIGAGQTLSFYWVGKWKVNNEWINGKEYHSFGEDRRFAFKMGTLENDTKNGTIYQDFKGLRYTKQTLDDEWVTYTLPIADRLFNGVSPWGCAGKVTALRIQSSYTKRAGMSEEEKQNVLLIKYIKGIKNPRGTTYDFTDSDVINSYLFHDSEEALREAAENQTAVNGFIFPKNNDCIYYDGSGDEVSTNTTVYHKEDSLYLYGKYAEGKQILALKAKESAPIDINEHTTLVFSYQNFSYVDKLMFSFYTKFDENGVTKHRKVITNFAMPTRMDTTVEAKINMFGANNFKGVITQIDVEFTPVGVDNLLKLAYLKFDEYEPKATTGFNFNDLYLGGFTYEEGLTATYDAVHKGTKLEATEANRSFYKDVASYEISAYEKISLTYQKQEEGITKALVSLTIDDEVTTYEFVFDLSPSPATLTQALTSFGTLTKISIQLVGKGTIYFRSIDWIYPKETLDFTTGEYSVGNAKFQNEEWKSYTFNTYKLALTSSQATSAIYARLGVRNYQNNGTRIENMSLAGKSKIMILYQNKASNVQSVMLGFGALLKADYLEGQQYLYQDAIPSSAGVTINGVTKSTAISEENKVFIHTNMADDEWAVAEFILDPFFTSQENECYLATFYLSVNNGYAQDDSFAIRSFTIK